MNKMRKMKSILVSFLSLGIALGSLTGCTENDVLETKEAKRDVTLSWWGNDNRHQYTLEGVKEFELKNPNIRVSCQYAEWSGFRARMNIEMASHTNADVMQMNYSWVYQYNRQQEYFYDLGKLSDWIDLSNYTEQELSYGTVDGTLVALPIAMNALTYYYNRTLFDSYHLDIPQDWDDLFDAAETMKRDGVYPMCMSDNQIFMTLVAYAEQVSGIRFMEADGTANFTEDEYAIMLRFYKKLVDQKVIPHIEDFDKSLVTAGKAAGIAAWISDGNNYWKESIKQGNEVAIGNLPVLSHAKRYGWYTKPATMYSIYAESENVEEAAKLLNFLVSDVKMAKLQGIEKGVPTNRAAREVLEGEGLLEGVQYDAFLKMQEETADLELLSPYFEDDERILKFNEVTDEYLYDQISLEDCARKVMELF